MRRCINCFKEFEDEYEVCPHCGEVYTGEAAEPIHLLPGTILYDRYYIGKVVGEGGFGIVYKAWDIKLDNIIAVKEFFVPRIITRVPGQNEVIVSRKTEKEFAYRKERFLAEARNMAKFGNHPNIPNVYEFFEENGTAYIVMELLKGAGLNTYMAQHKGKIDIGFAINVANEVGNALLALHDKKIVHCDVAPDNIFIMSDKDKHIKLMDLGAAKLADATDSSIDIILKPGYSPIEQYDFTKTIGPWTDIYALGATLYVMLTGVKPDESTNRKIEDTLVEPKKINPSISENMNNTILKAMAIDRHMRFKNVGDLLKAINGERKVVSLDREKKNRRIRRLAAVLVSCLALLIGGIFSTNYYNSKKSMETLKPTDIVVWYCADEDADENKAMEAVKEDFETTFEGVTVQLVAYDRNEYQSRLEDAARNGELPNLFESTDTSEEVLKQARIVDNIMHTEQFENALFLNQYDKYYSMHKKIPLAIDIPVAVIITNGPVFLEYDDDYFGDISKLGENIAISDEYASLVKKNYSFSFKSEDEFLDMEENTSPVLLTATREINDIKNAIPNYTKKFVYPDSSAVYCDFAYEWSLGEGNEEQNAASEKLLSWMLGNVYQSYLMVSQNNEGYIPVNEICFNTKVENKNLKPIKKIVNRLKFSSDM